jgi:hypothetical protein
MLDLCREGPYVDRWWQYLLDFTLVRYQIEVFKCFVVILKGKRLESRAGRSKKESGHPPRLETGKGSLENRQRLGIFPHDDSRGFVPGELRRQKSIQHQIRFKLAGKRAQGRGGTPLAIATAATRGQIALDARTAVRTRVRLRGARANGCHRGRPQSTCPQ